MLRAVVGGPVAQWRRTGLPYAVAESTRGPSGALVGSVVEVFPDGTFRHERDGRRRTLNGDGQIIAGLKRTVACGQAQHVGPDARKRGRRIGLMDVAKPNRARSADLTPGHRQCAGRVRLAVVGRTAAECEDERKTRSCDTLVQPGIHDGQPVARILQAGRPRAGAGAPVYGVIAVSRRVQPLQGGPEPVRIGRPRRLVVIAHHVHIDVWDKNRARVGVHVRLVGSLQRQCFAVPLQCAGKRPEDLHRGWNTIFDAECGGVAADDQQQAVRRDFGVGREIEAYAVQSPSVCRVVRVVQFHRRVGDAFQFHKLVPAGRGMILDFVDHHRTDARSGVQSPECIHPLRRILRLTRADDVTSETDTVLRRPKCKPITVTGQISIRVCGVEVNFLAVRIESKVVRRSRIRVPVVFREHNKAACRDGGAGVVGGDAKLLRRSALVSEIPVADVHVGRVRVVKLD